eukprot:6747191-Heterocapsa_arctica.AAC.1
MELVILAYYETQVAVLLLDEETADGRALTAAPCQESGSMKSTEELVHVTCRTPQHRVPVGTRGHAARVGLLAELRVRLDDPLVGRLD